jgi:hypothetical protein
MTSDNKKNGYSRKQFMKNMGGAIFSGSLLSGAVFPLGARAG